MEDEDGRKTRQDRQTDRQTDARRLMRRVNNGEWQRMGLANITEWVVLAGLAEWGRAERCQPASQGLRCDGDKRCQASQNAASNVENRGVETPGASQEENRSRGVLVVSRRAIGLVFFDSRVLETAGSRG